MKGSDRMHIGASGWHYELAVELPGFPGQDRAMPELPDVEIFRRYFQSTSLYQPVAAVRVPSTGLLQRVSAAEIGRKLHEKQFVAVSRHGKYLIAEVSQRGCLVLHFGMSGFLKYHKRPEQTSKHPGLIIQFSNGYRLIFDCQRKFGAILWSESVEQLREEKQLGPDPLQEAFDVGTFRRILKKRRGFIKSLLMNQKILAGIGNIYSDEILFQAGIHPRRKVCELDEKKAQELYRRMQAVLQTAIDLRVGEKGWPTDWLLPRREGGQSCPRCGGYIERLDISGRHAYCCSRHQR